MVTIIYFIGALDINIYYHYIDYGDSGKTFFDIGLVYQRISLKGYIMNKPQIEQTEIGEMLGSVKFYTTKFESTAKRQELIDGLSKDEYSPENGSAC